MEELTQDGAQLARTMLMATAQLAESMARVQAQRAWMAQSRSAAQAAQAQQQIAAEQDAARMIFRPLTDDRYWRDAPQLDRVVQAYTAAVSWAEHDPEARAAVQLIKQHAEGRWGRAAIDEMQIPPRCLTVEAGRTPADASAGKGGLNAAPTKSLTARLHSAPGVAQPIQTSLRSVRTPAKEPSWAASKSMLLGKYRKVHAPVSTRLSHGR